MQFLNYSFVTPDTNAANRARKNFLFSSIGKGAQSSWFLFSLIETAKFNGKSLEDILRCLFEKAPYTQTKEDWEKLFPWNIETTPFQFHDELVELAVRGYNWRILSHFIKKIFSTKYLGFAVINFLNTYVW